MAFLNTVDGNSFICFLCFIVFQRYYESGTKGKIATKAKKRKTENYDDVSEEEWSKQTNSDKTSFESVGDEEALTFNKSFKLSPELADVVGSEVMPRQEVVKRLWAVIKERELQDPSNRQFAICDHQLKKVFGKL